MATEAELVLIAKARIEYETDGVLATDTYMALTNAGYVPEALIESFEEGDTE